jgi:3-hydroxybutyryl-CoA dehydrogenase
MMALVEIIRGLQTSVTPPTKPCKAMAKALGKTPITVKNAPGFVVNRILVPMINEAFLRAGRRPGHRLKTSTQA